MSQVRDPTKGDSGKDVVELTRRFSNEEIAIIKGWRFVYTNPFHVDGWDWYWISPPHYDCGMGIHIGVPDYKAIAAAKENEG